MPKISVKKEEKISEQIIHLLYSRSPALLFTSHIAEEIARDEEYTKKLLFLLEKKRVVTKVSKSPEGFDYAKRLRWRISSQAFEALKNLDK